MPTTASLLGGRLSYNYHLSFLSFLIFFFSSLFYIPSTVLPPTPSTIFLCSAIRLLSAALTHLICHLPSMFLIVFYSISNYYQPIYHLSNKCLISCLLYIYHLYIHQCVNCIYCLTSVYLLSIIYLYLLLNGTSYAKQ